MTATAPAPTPTPAPDLAKKGKPDYGLDAPSFQLYGRYGGVIAVVVGRMLNEYGVMHSLNWAVSVGSALMSAGVSFFVVSAVMYLGSKFGKLLLRDAILNSIAG